MNFKEWLILTEKIMIKDQEFRDSLLALQQIRKTHPNPENLAVTFTRIDKVGLNPESKYDTPLGIYLYPIDYVIEKKMMVPFAKDQPHINVCEFTRPEKILHMTSDVSNQDGMELLNVFPKEKVDKAWEYFNELRSNYSKLWTSTRVLANNKPIQWNINLRKCGIDGFVDYGTGTIHPNEPTQCVVFAANALKLLHSIDNPMYYKKTDKFGVTKIYTKKNTDKYDSNKMSDKEIANLLQYRSTSLNIGDLLKSATDKDKIAKLIINTNPEFSFGNIYSLLYAATNKNKIAELIIEKKPNLSGHDVQTLLGAATDKDKMANRILEILPNISAPNIRSLLGAATHKDEMAEIIINKKPELDSWGVSYLLAYAIDKEKIAEQLQEKEDNISKLSDQDFYDLILGSKDKPKMAKILKRYYKNKTKKIQKILDKYLTQTIAAK